MNHITKIHQYFKCEGWKSIIWERRVSSRIVAD